MTCSGFSTLYGIATAACTYEGDNTVMLLQTARYLMKVWQQATEGVALTPTVAYLRQAISGSNGPGRWENSTVCIVSAFQEVAAG
jgi:acyl-CoA oxidase